MEPKPVEKTRAVMAHMELNYPLGIVRNNRLAQKCYEMFFNHVHYFGQIPIQKRGDTFRYTKRFSDVVILW